MRRWARGTGRRGTVLPARVDKPVGKLPLLR